MNGEIFAMHPDLHAGFSCVFRSLINADNISLVSHQVFNLIFKLPKISAHQQYQFFTNWGWWWSQWLKVTQNVSFFNVASEASCFEFSCQKSTKTSNARHLYVIFKHCEDQFSGLMRIKDGFSICLASDNLPKCKETAAASYELVIGLWSIVVWKVKKIIIISNGLV